MDLPLKGIKVIDFTQYQQGTVGTLLLADWGADVIKLEPRLVGEPGRAAGLAYYQAHNRNKRSVTIDLKKEKAKEIVYRLVKEADIFAQNFRPGVAERLGFGYEALSAINPRIIYLTGSGFGLKGPWKDKPGFDAVGQAMGGIMSLAGPPGSPDLPLGAAVADQTGGFMLGYGALLALIDRQRTGKGQMVEASLMGSVIGLIGWIMQDYLLSGQIRGKTRARVGSGVFSCTLRAGDGKSFIIQTFGRAAKEKVFKAAGIDPKDPRFETGEKMRQNIDELIETLEKFFSSKTREEALEILGKEDVVCAPVYNLAEVAAEPQVAANEYLVEIEHPQQGKIRILNNPVTLGRQKARVGAAPELGQHTEEVLREAGYSEAEIAAFRKEEVV
ncbi:MAG: CoA transferase [Deltaproteobacteria bacterium]|nr:CoA transferase [Deltaproteobacteria bacterium]